ncbi:Transcriptional regulator, AsnC family [hydrothermal vent metagenome]|uniref:Transcriptional regulator, AsnC family n=1 Tax=hydrothermal vent metagenome TaxID=652676 RepID=A0A3B0RF97_9ZZZZ
MTSIIDDIDAKILKILQQDASISVADIAAKVGLSSSPCWRRIRRLEEENIIVRNVTILNREKLGLGFEVYAAVKLERPTRANLREFEKAIRVLPEVLECATVTGAVDYVLRIVTTDMHTYDDFLRDKILSLELVQTALSRIVIRSVKDTTALPLERIAPKK